MDRNDPERQTEALKTEQIPLPLNRLENPCFQCVRD